MNKDKHRIKQLENELSKQLNVYSDLQAQNKSLRKGIDVHRKEQKNQTRVNKGYVDDVKESKAGVEALAKKNNYDSRKTSD